MSPAEIVRSSETPSGSPYMIIRYSPGSQEYSSGRYANWDEAVAASKTLREWGLFVKLIDLKTLFKEGASKAISDPPPLEGTDNSQEQK